MANCLKHIKKTNEIIFTVFSLHIKTQKNFIKKLIKVFLTVFFSLYKNNK